MAANNVTEATEVQPWEIDGMDVVDKRALLGKAFRITAMSFWTGNSNIQYVYCDAELPGGMIYTFNDSSSTGIRKQLADLWLQKTGEEVTYPPATDAAWREVSINCPNGLRESVYNREGTKEKGHTWYIAANGKRKTVK